MANPKGERALVDGRAAFLTRMGPRFANAVFRRLNQLIDAEKIRAQWSEQSSAWKYSVPLADNGTRLEAAKALARLMDWEPRPADHDLGERVVVQLIGLPPEALMPTTQRINVSIADVEAPQIESSTREPDAVPIAEKTNAVRDRQ